MKQPLTLIVDDEPDIRELLEITLNRMDVRTCSVDNIADAKKILQQQTINLCLTDMQLPDGNGLELVKYIQNNYRSVPVAVITAFGSMETAVRALKNGAFDFVSKPVDLNELRQLVKSAISANKKAPKERRTRHILLGDSAVMENVRSRIFKVARSQAPIFISGESGSGKELVAGLIHKQSPRGDKQLIAVNCGAIPHELMESEFFGHKKGSFSGAVTDKEGLFQAADGGSLFLDEIADLPQSLQVKLLRAIQEKKIRPVGGQQEIPVDVRLLSATHKDLGKMVNEGKFRQDLFYRINVIDINVPPLRARISDIPQLVQQILLKLAEKNNCNLATLSDSALIALRQYYSPGNVRELENILERAIALHEGDVIEPEDLNLPVDLAMEISDAEFDNTSVSLEDYLLNIERKAIQKALEASKWNKTAAAKRLGMSFRSLRYRLKKLELESD